MIKLIVAGAAGRMGARIVALAKKDRALRVVYGLESAGKTADVGVPVGSDRLRLRLADVVIDFTVAEATLSLAPDVARARKAYVIGTTGFSPAQEKKLAALARRIPILKSSNMSLGVNVFFQAAQDL